MLLLIVNLSSFRGNSVITIRSYLTVIFLVTSMLISFGASARDDHLMLSIEEAMNTEAAKEKLNRGFRFYFGKQAHLEPIKDFGEFQSNKKSNGVGKSDKQACEWAFLSAMLSFQDRISREGGNAVINLRSFYKKNLISSETEYQCGAGNLMAGVTFLGDVVTLPE